MVLSWRKRKAFPLLAISWFLGSAPAETLAQSHSDLQIPGNSSIYAHSGQNGGRGSTAAIDIPLEPCQRRVMHIRNVSGRIGCCGISNNGADGRPTRSVFNVKSTNGLSGWRAKRGISLVGVFHATTDTDLSPPEPIDYASIGFDSPSYSPELNQVFFIGNGRSESLAKRQFFHVPEDAASLSLGIIDRELNSIPGAYHDNPGRLELDIIVEGCTIPIS